MQLIHGSKHPALLSTSHQFLPLQDLTPRRPLSVRLTFPSRRPSLEQLSKHGALPPSRYMLRQPHSVASNKTARWNSEWAPGQSGAQDRSGNRNHSSQRRQKGAATRLADGDGQPHRSTQRPPALWHLKLPLNKSATLSTYSRADAAQHVQEVSQNGCNGRIVRSSCQLQYRR